MTMMTVVADPTGLFEIGAQYDPADIYGWLAEDMLPEGLELENGRRMVVRCGELLHKGQNGKAHRRRKPSNKSRWIVLVALDDALERGDTPSYRELSEITDLALGSISWHLEQLEGLGLVERARYERRGTRVTALGHKKAEEVRTT